MKRGLIVSVVATCLVCFGALAGVLAANWKPLLGLDLRGGLSVVYCPAAKGSNSKCDTKPVATSKLNTVVSILDNRANAFGVGQPNINVQGSDVVVQLPGVKNARKVESQLGQTAQLYFRPVLCYAPPYAGASKSTKKTKKTSTSTTTTTVPNKKPSGSQSGYVTPPTCPSTYTPSSTNPDPALFATLAHYETTPVGLDEPTKTVLLDEKGTADRIELGPSEASGEVIASATAVYTSSQGYIIDFTLTKSGTSIWDNLANKNYHKYVADDLGGIVISSPPEINATGSQFGSSGEITGSFSASSANDLAIDLDYGALPVSLVPETTEVVSPTLGSSSLHAGLLAGLLGLLLVMIYTIFYYRALGVVVVLGLVTTAALLYGLISLLGQSIQLTLDLSGVTGLIVSVGITVDSYVVYFERLKDEVRAGRSVRASVDRGFKSAYRTILSADAVSLIGAVVLWWLSVGDVRGFAFMLGLSTIIDMLTAYFFTRPLVILLGRNRIFTEARHLGVARGLAAPTQEASL